MVYLHESIRFPRHFVTYLEEVFELAPSSHLYLGVSVGSDTQDLADLHANLASEEACETRKTYVVAVGLP
jgi:hypothetical protein